MLKETYEKFKQQLLARKTGDIQLPDVVQIADEQVHHLCSYNHYYVKNEDTIEIQGQYHNDIYDTGSTNSFFYQSLTLVLVPLPCSSLAGTLSYLFV